MSYETNEAWKKENTVKLTVRVMNSSGIPAAMEVARNDSGLTNSGYVIAALREKLIRDGYMQSPSIKDSTAFRLREASKEYGCTIGGMIDMLLNERNTFESETGATHITANQAIIEALDLHEESLKTTPEDDYIAAKLYLEAPKRRALESMHNTTGVSIVKYINETVCSRLREEGYLKD